MKMGNFSYLLLYAQNQAQCLTQGRYSRNTCGMVTKTVIFLPPARKVQCRAKAEDRSAGIWSHLAQLKDEQLQGVL